MMQLMLRLVVIMELLNIQSGNQNHNIGHHGDQLAQIIKIAVTDQENKASSVLISSGMLWKVMIVHLDKVPLAMHGVRIDAVMVVRNGPYRTATMTRLSSVTTLNCGARALTVEETPSL